MTAIIIGCSGLKSLSVISQLLVEAQRSNPDRQFSPFVPTRFPKDIASALLGMHRKYVAPVMVKTEHKQASAIRCSVGS